MADVQAGGQSAVPEAGARALAVNGDQRVRQTLFFLGLLTYLRLAQNAGEDLLYLRAINRIRRFYLELDPAAPSWFLLGGHDDIHGVTANTGLVASSRHLLSHAATMVAVTTSMIGGVFVALAVGGLGG